jgi:transcriptional antiterminator NusG
LGVLLIGLGCPVLIFVSSELGERFLAFGRDSVRELKVVWPERKGLVQMTAYVFRLCGGNGIVLWLTDKTARNGCLRLDPGMEKIMSDLNITTRDVVVADASMRWPLACNGYVVHTYSGMEKSGRTQYRRAHQPCRHAIKFGRFLNLPRSGRNQEWPEETTERRFFPGYVLVEMVMDDETWRGKAHANESHRFRRRLKTVPPISEEEMQKIVDQMQVGTLTKPLAKVRV